MATESKRFGSVIKLKPDKYERYKKLHAAVWPQVQKNRGRGEGFENFPSILFYCLQKTKSFTK